MSRSPSRNQSSPPQLAGRLERVPASRRHRPQPSLGVDEAAERVEQAVEVGRDVEPEDLDVVSDVADDRQLPGLEDRREPTREACAAAAARQQDDLSRGNGEERAGARTERDAQALEVDVRVDVELELGDPTTVTNGACARNRSRAPRRRRAGEDDGSGKESAFVVPSDASTSASPASARRSKRIRRRGGKVGVDDERVPVDLRETGDDRCAEASAGIPHHLGAAGHDGASSVTTSTRPTCAAASTTSPSIATATAARSDRTTAAASRLRGRG